MSNTPLLRGDAVMIYIDDITRCNPNNARSGLGFIRFIGFIPCLESGKFTQSIGIELIEKIHDGHNGMVNNMQYFNVENGYGIIVPITNIIKKVSTTELMLELKRTVHILQEKNKYIQQLQSIISRNKNKKKCLPDTTPKLLSRIDVNMAPHPKLASARNTFILPAPITPISPRSPNSPLGFATNIEYEEFEEFDMNQSDNNIPTTATNTAKIPNYIHTKTPSSISTRMSISKEVTTNEPSVSSIGTYKSRKSHKRRKSRQPSMSLDVFIPNEKQKLSEPISSPYCNSPLTPYTPTICYSPNILREDAEQSESMSFAKRIESLRKKPVPEPRKKKKRKSKRMKQKVAFQSNVHYF